MKKETAAFSTLSLQTIQVKLAATYNTIRNVDFLNKRLLYLFFSKTVQGCIILQCF